MSTRFILNLGPGWIIEGDRAWLIPSTPAGEPKPLGPEWIEIGYTTDDGVTQ